MTLLSLIKHYINKKKKRIERNSKNAWQFGINIWSYHYSSSTITTTQRARFKCGQTIGVSDFGVGQCQTLSLSLSLSKQRCESSFTYPFSHTYTHSILSLSHLPPSLSISYTYIPAWPLVR